MHPLILILVFLFCAAGLAWAQAPQSREKLSFEATDAVDFNLDSGEFSATNGIVIKAGESRLSARKITGNQNTGDLQAEGGVRLEAGGRVWVGDKLEYNFRTGKMAGEDFRFGQYPFFVQGEVMTGDLTNNLYVMAEGFVTTDDYSEPGYRVRAKSIVIIKDEYVEAKDAVLYLGKVPVFYFPRYRRYLQRHPNYWVLEPGYKSQFGPYLMTSYNWFWDERLESSVTLNAYAKRGVGFGPNFSYNLPKFGDGKVWTFFIHDLDRNESGTGLAQSDNRGIVWFEHQTQVTSNLTVKAAVRYQNDAVVVRDFFENIYRQNPQPTTFLEVQQQWQNFTFNALTVGRVNDSVETVERLPDITFTGLPQQVGRTPLYYESSSSLGWYRRQFAYDVVDEYSAWRADTFHQFSLPLNFFGWLNLTPRAGGRYTHYSSSDVFGQPLNEANRALFNTSTELSTKASRIFPDVHSDLFKLDGLRHIIQPSIIYAYVPDPNVVPLDLPRFDYLTPSTRLLPITFPEYNDIDSIDSENTFRFALRNKLQTKRNGVIDTVVNWAVYTDWRLSPRAEQGTFSDIYSDLDWKPFSWLILSSELRYDINEKQWNAANNAVTLLPNNVWNLSVGQRYQREVPGIPNSGNDLYFATLFYRLSENWSARASIFYEAHYGVIEEQRYTLYRDFRSFVSALNLSWQKNPIGNVPDSFTIGVTFSSKAFPTANPNNERLFPTQLLGD